MRKTRATAVVLCALAAAPALAQGGWFTDVPDSHPRVEAVRYARDQQLLQGYPDGRLDPDGELTAGQFETVARRLYDRYDRWTRADWAQVLYAGLPSLTGDPSAGGGGGVEFRCGWPLGEAYPVPPLTSLTTNKSYPLNDIVFPVRPCEPPVAYRIELRAASAEEGEGQIIRLPYTEPGGDGLWTTAFAWPTDRNVRHAYVTVAEIRPAAGGQADRERRLGEQMLLWQTIRARPVHDSAGGGQ